MKTQSDFNLYTALMRKINLNAIKPVFCGVKLCIPECQEYKVKLFSKYFTLEYIFSNKIVSIESNTIKICEVVLSFEEIDYYSNNEIDFYCNYKTKLI